MGRKTKMKKKKKKEMENHSNLMKEKVSEKNNWSNLLPDVLRPILESLSPRDFHQAKTVCSDWYSVWKTCVRLTLRPWQITYRGDKSMLFDPKEDNIEELLGFSCKSYCMAGSGNCLLLKIDNRGYYISNLLKRKTIELPGTQEYDIYRCNRSAVLWINERTEDYFVALASNQHHVFSLKSDSRCSEWNSHDIYVDLFDMAYKDNKLYLYTLTHHIKVIDFSGGSLIIVGNNYPFNFVEQPWEYIWRRRIAIGDSGEVLIVLSLKEVIHDEEKLLFYVFKMNFESEQWERVYSIGDDEMLIFGHGVTIKAPVQDVGDGIKSDSICFVDNDLWPDSDRPSNCGVFDLATSRITWPKRFGAYIDQTRWFVS